MRVVLSYRWYILNSLRSPESYGAAIAEGRAYRSGGGAVEATHIPSGRQHAI